MRLRRETGDFQIAINSENAVNTIRKGLSAEDFVGELVNVNGTFEIVNSAKDTETGSVIKTNSFELTYTKATGAITAQEGGSGSGGGSEPLFVGATINANPSKPSDYTVSLDVTWETINEAYQSGRLIYIGNESRSTMVIGCGGQEEIYNVLTASPNASGDMAIITFFTSQSDGYPSYSTF